MSEANKKFTNYLESRGMPFSKEIHFYTPRYLIPYMPENKDAYILDIGCGLGSFVGDCIFTHNRTNVKGIEVSPEAVRFCKSFDLPVELIQTIKSFADNQKQKYDLILMSHVLEHLPKEQIIETLKIIRTQLLSENGKFIVAVPNAQSSTNAYWAYEDFTHTMLFTTGSLIYVMKMAGFDKLEFTDLDGIAGQSKKDCILRNIFLPLYKNWKRFERYITCSYYHKASPISYAYELKIVGYK